MFTEVEKAVIHHHGKWPAKDDDWILYVEEKNPLSYQICRPDHQVRGFVYLCNHEEFEKSRDRLYEVHYTAKFRDCSFEDWLKELSVVIEVRKWMSPTGIQQSEFKREERYIVVKLKDCTDGQIDAFRAFLRAMTIRTRECVVVEPDWPNYEQTWRDIEAVANGTFVERKDPVWLPSPNDVCLLSGEKVKITAVDTVKMRAAFEHVGTGKAGTCLINILTPISKSDADFLEGSDDDGDAIDSFYELNQAIKNTIQGICITTEKSAQAQLQTHLAVLIGIQSKFFSEVFSDYKAGEAS